ncbi:hypothetical protein [Mangrovicoccus ximenensis]|uniref:hypothetical protein n=1 Tax=Mangrovicoccus ximenensis TaxID=1911570 RepID=UPI000D34A2C6|nr:hypothetical protein [Mangrovicoccus ximenensis]
MTEATPPKPPVVLVMERDPFIQSDIGMILREVIPDAVIHMCRDTDAADRLAAGLADLTLCVLKMMRHDPMDAGLAARAAGRGARVLLLGDTVDLKGGNLPEDLVAVLPVPFSGSTFRDALAGLGFRAFS